jgi:predicted RNA binding protein YcfA (HicA-like mRNA interferase family)
MLERRGWLLLRIHGSHHILDAPDGKRRVSVPVHASETLKIGLLSSILKQTGLTEQDL